MRKGEPTCEGVLALRRFSKLSYLEFRPPEPDGNWHVLNGLHEPASVVAVLIWGQRHQRYRLLIELCELLAEQEGLPLLQIEVDFRDDIILMHSGRVKGIEVESLDIPHVAAVNLEGTEGQPEL